MQSVPPYAVQGRSASSRTTQRSTVVKVPTSWNPTAR